ncbi:MAG: hypothetical protein EU539_04485 [Promethearchaeota archaeon]|nr:MAG: hypothetical protein EU539_04485 [Candidatus Lokiarchaeota archaeon]
MKIKLVNQIKNELLEDIKDSIDESYVKDKSKPYTLFLIEVINKIKIHRNDKSSISIIMNSRDYDYFIKNLDVLSSQFKNEIVIKKAEQDFIGGFKLFQQDTDIFYDYTIETIIDKNETLIQEELSKITEEEEIKIIQDDLERFIQHKKMEKDDYLKEYDSI